MSTANFRHFIHKKIIDHLPDLQAWFSEKSKNQNIPFYSSFDIRDSDFKIACVDANLFPAGFNNICDEDQNRSSKLIQNYLKKFDTVKKIILLAEEHTKNLYYWDNIYTIRSLIESTGYKVQVCVPGKNILSPTRIQTASGRSLEIEILKNSTGDLIISNNDFSAHYNLPQHIPCIPPPFMGWLKRKKHHFFKEYNSLTREFSDLLHIDPWSLQIETKLFSPFKIEAKETLEKLKSTAEEMLNHLKEKYQSFSIKEKPYLFLKNNSGTYGLGILNIHSSEDLKHWSYKSRKTMKASKGETQLNQVIIQEGVPSALYSSDNSIAEPVVYMIGNQTAGAFLRSHKKKNHKTNLNSPGSVFKRFCISDLEIKMQGLVMENVYGWLAKIGSLALAQEIKNNSPVK